MIDWLTVRIPVRLPAPIAGGWTVKLAQDGTEERRTPHRLNVQGSFESSLAIRAPSTSELEVSGNLVKWLQGHNLYGTSDPLGLLWAALQRLEALPGVLPCSLRDMGLYSPVSLSDAIVTRIDCTAMLLLDTDADVLWWLRIAEQTGRLEHRGKGLMRGNTLVYGHAGGKNFTRWQIVLYSKGQEISAHPLPEMMMSDAEVLAYVNRCLRVEVRLGRLELKEKGLRALGEWTAQTAAMMWGDKVARVKFNEAEIGLKNLDHLPRNLRTTYAAWTTGEDLRNMLPRRTFYHYRRQLLDLAGIDISIAPPTVPTAQIIPFRRTLEAVPAGRPPWADRIDRDLRAAGAYVFDAAS